MYPQPSLALVVTTHPSPTCRPDPLPADEGHGQCDGGRGDEADDGAAAAGGTTSGSSSGGGGGNLGHGFKRGGCSGPRGHRGMNDRNVDIFDLIHISIVHAVV